MACNSVFLNRGASLAAFLASLVCIATIKPASSGGLEPNTDGALTVSIVAPAYWCPYACKADGAREGFTVEIARAALESEGLHVIYSNIPFDRALMEARQGRVDAVAPTFKAEAKGFVFPDHALSITEYCFYVPDDNPWRYTGIESLVNLSLLATSGYSYGEKMDEYIAENLDEGVTLIMGDDVPGRLRDLIRLGRFDAFLDDRLLFESGHNSANLTNAGCLEERHVGYLALSPEHPERSALIADAFDRGFQTIFADGRLCDILEKYHLNAGFIPESTLQECSQADNYASDIPPSQADPDLD